MAEVIQLRSAPARFLDRAPLGSVDAEEALDTLFNERVTDYPAPECMLALHRSVLPDPGSFLTRLALLSLARVEFQAMIEEITVSLMNVLKSVTATPHFRRGKSSAPGCWWCNHLPNRHIEDKGSDIMRHQTYHSKY
jgi:hypothetical protein